MLVLEVAEAVFLRPMRSANADLKRGIADARCQACQALSMETVGCPGLEASGLQARNRRSR